MRFKDLWIHFVYQYIERMIYAPEFISHHCQNKTVYRWLGDPGRRKIFRSPFTFIATPQFRSRKICRIYMVKIHMRQHTIAPLTLEHIPDFRKSLLFIKVTKA